MAPEVIDPALMYGKPVDVWSFGVMAREVNVVVERAISSLDLLTHLCVFFSDQGVGG